MVPGRVEPRTLAESGRAENSDISYISDTGTAKLNIDAANQRLNLRTRETYVGQDKCE